MQGIRTCPLAPGGSAATTSTPEALANRGRVVPGPRGLCAAHDGALRGGTASSSAGRESPSSALAAASPGSGCARARHGLLFHGSVFREPARMLERGSSGGRSDQPRERLRRTRGAVSESGDASPGRGAWEDAPRGGVLFSAEEIATATGGTLLAVGPPGRICTDTRQLAPRDWFLALRGARFDGREFLGAAAAAGCAGAVSEGEMPDGWQERPEVPEDGREEGPLRGSRGFVSVEDGLQALQDLARSVRLRFHGPVVGITGSVGKSSATALAQLALLPLGGPVHKTAGNFNNHIGVPLSLLAMSRRAVACVLELGMSAEGEIAALAQICAPSIRVVLNVGPAHLDTLGSLEAVARAKGELVRTAQPGDCCVLNADDPRVADMAVPEGCTTVFFGRAPHCEVRILSAALAPSGTSIRIALRHQSRKGGAIEEAEVDIASPLLALASNVAAAAAVGVAAGVPLQDALASMGSFSPVKQRMHVEFLATPASAAGLASKEAASQVAGLMAAEQQGPSGTGEGGSGPAAHVKEVLGAGSGTEERTACLVLIDDSYNANPTSMDAALELLQTFPAHGRRYAFLGDMLELGPVAAAEHRRTLHLCCSSGESSTGSFELQGPARELHCSGGSMNASLSSPARPSATSTGTRGPDSEARPGSLQPASSSSQSARPHPIHGVILVGPQFRSALAGLQQDGAALPPIAEWCATAEAASQWLVAQLDAQTIGAGDVVLVKGSRSMGMDLVADACRAALQGHHGEVS